MVLPCAGRDASTVAAGAVCRAGRPRPNGSGAQGGGPGRGQGKVAGACWAPLLFCLRVWSAACPGRVLSGAAVRNYLAVESVHRRPVSLDSSPLCPLDRVRARSGSRGWRGGGGSVEGGGRGVGFDGGGFFGSQTRPAKVDLTLRRTGGHHRAHLLYRHAASMIHRRIGGNTREMPLNCISCV